MTRLKARISRRLAAFLPDEMRREDGTASMEFVLVIPIIMMIFMASFESGLLMTRSIMLEQAVDIAMREVRLGHLSPVTNETLTEEICSLTVIFPNCENTLKIQMNRIDTATWQIPVAPDQCIVRDELAVAATEPDPGAQNDLMLVRACVVLEAMFPTSGIAMNLPLDDGGYALVARTAFSVEPL